jgi:hypothetical protein
MRRALGLLLAAGSLTAGGGIALAASVPTSHVSGMIVCPLESSRILTTTCCGPPVVTAGTAAVVCCAAAAQIACPVGITVASTPNPSTAGKRVTIAGRWSGGTATAVLWQRLPSSKSFQRAAQTTTGSSGQFQFVRNGVKTNREWYVTVGTDRSATLGQRVRAVVTIAALGRKAHGHVTPNHRGERILFEQHTTAGWRVIARPRLNRNSDYSVRLPGRGEVDFRAVFPGDARNIRSISSRFFVTA